MAVHVAGAASWGSSSAVIAYVASVVGTGIIVEMSGGVEAIEGQ